MLKGMCGFRIVSVTHAMSMLSVWSRCWNSVFFRCDTGGTPFGGEESAALLLVFETLAAIALRVIASSSVMYRFRMFVSFVSLCLWEWDGDQEADGWAPVLLPEVGHVVD